MKQLTFENYLNDFNQSFSGWDFSYLTNSSRMQEFPCHGIIENNLRFGNDSIHEVIPDGVSRFIKERYL